MRRRHIDNSSHGNRAPILTAGAVAVAVMAAIGQPQCSSSRRRYEPYWVAWRLLSLDRGWSHATRERAREAHDTALHPAGEGPNRQAGPRELRRALGSDHGTVKRIALQLGYGMESVRSWVAQADIDEGHSAGLTTTESAEMKALKQEVRQLRRANEILKRASAFFVAELDRRYTK